MKLNSLKSRKSGSAVIARRCCGRDTAKEGVIIDSSRFLCVQQEQDRTTIITFRETSSGKFVMKGEGHSFITEVTLLKMLKRAFSSNVAVEIT